MGEKGEGRRRREGEGEREKEGESKRSSQNKWVSKPQNFLSPKKGVRKQRVVQDNTQKLLLGTENTHDTHTDTHLFRDILEHKRGLEIGCGDNILNVRDNA